jgi:autotransporter adhesin
MNGQAELFSNTAVSSTQGAVSVGSAGGERQITNVAGGTQATDAVNVRQLQAVQSRAVNYNSNADGSINYNQVTLGNGQAPNGTTISNVAPGVAGTDAVNVNQLNAQSGQINAQTNQLRDAIRANQREANAGTAGAMAMAGMPQAYMPGKNMVAGGVAGYEGQSAIAIGYSSISDNGKWVMKFTGSANSRGSVGVSAGAGFQW